MPQVKSQRNQSIECARLIASFFVVFIHCPFPGKFGEIVTCVARFAVPMFFMISGYFSYGAGRKKLAGRLKHMVWLNVIATALYAFQRYLLESNFSWNVKECVLALAPGKEDLIRLLILNINPYSEHLWYLAAILVCDLILWAYAGFYEGSGIRYQPFYGLCTWLYVLQFVLGEMASMVGITVPYILCRNAFLMGLPMFGLGLFLREHRDRLMENFDLKDWKLGVLILLGLGYSLLRSVSVGAAELTAGMVVAVAALMLWMAEHPGLTFHSRFADTCVSKFGVLSATVYIIHQFIHTVYRLVCMQTVAAGLGVWEPRIRPLLVAGMSLGAAMLLERTYWLARRILRRKK